MSHTTPFWIHDPSILFTDLAFFPTSEMTKNEKLNALTRLAIVVAVGMAVAESANWLMFLGCSVLAIIVAGAFFNSKESTDNSKRDYRDDYNHDYNHDDNYYRNHHKEYFTMLPADETTTNFDLPNNYSAVDIIEEYAPQFNYHHPDDDVNGNGNNFELIEPAFEEPIRPRPYPNGQYLTHTDMLPTDEYHIHMNPSGGSRTAREYAGGMIMKREMAFRDDMTKSFKKTLDSRFRHDTTGRGGYSSHRGY